MGKKDVKLAVVVVVENREGKILSVRRPEDDEELPGMWGLPATSAEENEGMEEAFRRVGTEKLGVELKKEEFIARDMTERANYILVGEEHYCSISGEPEVDREAPGTQYTEWKWAEPEILKEAAGNGSLCCQIFLEHKGINY
jgi:ADP-ribose pyrophosphatase YjhB (NUDIX family)